MDFITGFFSNAVAITVAHPIDVVKSRFQINNNSASNITSFIWKTNGLKGFFRGLTPNIGTYPVFWAIFFQTKNINMDIFENNLLNKFTSSYISGNIASTFTNPLFVLKTRFQVKNNSRLDIIRDLTKNKKMLLKGLPSTYINNLKLGVQFPLYDYLKDKTNNILFSSFSSKFICSSIFYPLDLIRVIQRSTNQKLTIKDIAINTYKNKGFFGFYKGLVLYNSVSILNFTIMMSLLEILKS